MISLFTNFKINLNKKKIIFSFLVLIIFHYNSYAFLCNSPTINSTPLIYPTETWNSVVCSAGAVRYIEFNAIVGKTYSFTMLSAVGGDCQFDEEISIQRTSGQPVGGVYGKSFLNDEVSDGKEYFDWSPTVTGTYRVVISRFNSTDCNSLSTDCILSYISFNAVSNFSFWVGGTDNNWDLANNWRTSINGNYPIHSVPNSDLDVIIPFGSVYQPIIDDSTLATTNNLQINAGAELIDATMSASGGQVNVYGNFKNDGSYSRVGDVFTNLNGTNKTIGGTGTFNFSMIMIAIDASYTLASDLVLDQIYLDNSENTILNLDSFYLKIQIDFTQYGTINFNTGTLELNGVIYNATSSRWNCDTGTYFVNIQTGGFCEAGFTFYDLIINCPNSNYISNFDLTVIRNLTITSFTTFAINSTTLNVGGDFINNGTFSTVFGTVNFNGSSSQILGGNSSTTFYKLKLDNLYGIKFGKNTFVKNGGTLFLVKGYHDLSSNTLQVGSSSSSNLSISTGGLYSSTNNGSFKRYIPAGIVKSSGGFNYGLFPFAKSDSAMAKFEINSTINPTSGGFITGTPRFLSGSPINVDYTDDHDIVDYITLNRSVILVSSLNGGKYDFKLSASIFTMNGLSNASDLTLVTNTSAIVGHKGTYVSNSGTVTSPILVRKGIFNSEILTPQTFVIGTYNNQSTPLPITLLSFKVERNGPSNILKWSTASEINNHYFTIEKADESLNFKIINIESGANNSNHLIDYAFNDDNVNECINYYRLKSTDFDGHESSTNIISIDNRNNKNKTIIMKTNLLGQKVNDDYKGLQIVFYDDGTSEKIMF
jgi:hypothetical protein